MAYRCALASTRVSAAAVEATEFAAAADRHGVVSVPAIVVNGRLAWVGAVPEPRLRRAAAPGRDDTVDSDGATPRASAADPATRSRSASSRRCRRSAVLFDAHTHLGRRHRRDARPARRDARDVRSRRDHGLVHVLPRRARPRARLHAPPTTARSPTPRRRRTGSSPSSGSTSRSGPVEEASRCLDLGARGIKLHPRAQGFSLGDERLDDVFALAVERDVPILIHGGPRACRRSATTSPRSSTASRTCG